MSIKISQLPSASAVTSDDLIPIVDDIGGSPITRKATAQQLLRFITGSTFDTLSVTQITASSISASQYIGIPAADVLAAGNNTFTGINAFNNYYITASEGVTGSDAQFTTISGTIISASTYIGLPSPSSSVGGPEKSVQFNSASQTSGSANLTFDYNTSILSGVTAQFTTITGSSITGNLAQFTTISASTAEISGNILIYGTANLSANPTAAYIKYSSSLDSLVAFPGLYVSGALTASSNISASSAFFTNVSASTVSASSYLGLPSSTTPGGPEYSIQFNSGSALSGTNQLIYNYGTNILSGTVAQFNTITGSTISGSTGLFNVLSGNNAEFSGNIVIYGTASLDANPAAAYVLYSSSLDKIVIYPGVFIDGDLTLTTLNVFDISGSSINITDVSSSIVNSDSGSITSLTASNISGNTAQFTQISASVVSASSYIGIPEVTLSKTLIDTDTSLAASQRAVFATNTISSSISLVLPSVASADSRQYFIIKADSLSGSVFVSGSSPDLINGQPVFELNGPYQSITLISNGTNWFIF